MPTNGGFNEVIDLTGDDSVDGPPIPNNNHTVTIGNQPEVSTVRHIDHPLPIESDLISSSHEAMPSSSLTTTRSASMEEYHLSEFSDMFQQLLDLPPLQHDATEEAMRVITASLPNSKVWLEGDDANIKPYEVSNWAVPASLLQWRRVVIPSHRLQEPSFPVHTPSSTRPPCIRLVQSLSDGIRDTIHLPITSYPNWSKANSLMELKSKIDEAHRLGRMIMVVCSGQNQNYWLPRCFHQWAPLHPRLMFASIDRDCANKSDDIELRRKLLGFDRIDGVCFVSHIPTEETGRAFNGTRTSTEDIHTALLTRYHLSYMNGSISPLERNALVSALQVNWAMALQTCKNQLHIETSDYTFSFRLERTSLEALEDVDALIPPEGFIINSISMLEPIPLIHGFQVELRVEQRRSVRWMQLRENHAAQCTGLLQHRCSVRVPPFHEHSLHFQLEVQHKVRGGILADCIGFGKTACTLGLIVSQPVVPLQTLRSSYYKRHLDTIPSRATLVVVPSHLVFQWKEECNRFLGMTDVKVLTISRVSDLPTVKEIVCANIVIVSSALFDSDVYQSQQLGIDHAALMLATRRPSAAPKPAKSQSKGHKNANKMASSSSTNSLAAAMEKSLEVSRQQLPPTKTALLEREYIQRVHNLRRQHEHLIEQCATWYDSEYVKPRKRGRAVQQEPSLETSVLPLEVYYWQRLIIDEVHEVVTPPNPESVVHQALCCIEAHCRWGLTATPALESLDAIDRLSHLLRANVGKWDVQCAQDFITKAFSASQRLDRDYAPPVERTVLVPLSPEELTLYKQREYDLKRASMSEADLMEALLLQASHFALQSRNRNASLRGIDERGHDANAGDQLAAMRGEKIQRIDALRQRKTELVQAIEMLRQQQQALNMDNSLSEDQRRSKAMETVGRKEEAQDQLHEVNLELHQLQTSLDFFERTLSELRQVSTLPDCSICFEPTTFGAVCVLPCGHIFCVNCAIQLAEQRGECSTCREPLRALHWRVLHETDLHQPNVMRIEDMALNGDEAAAEVRMIDTADTRFASMGSKLAYLVTQLRVILQQEPHAKILVYCQWNNLKMKVRDALEAASLPYATLEGHADTLKEILRRFNDSSSDPKANILVCSLEAKAAGLNLQCAHHLVFVHPFFSLNEAQASAWEAQAIGRVLRPGQQRVVNIWRFVSLQTIDQEILVRRQRPGWRSHFNHL